MTFRIFGLSLTSINIVISFNVYYNTFKNFYLNMKKTNKKLEEFIRVDHAGERGAVKIYEGQLLALNTIIKNESLKKQLKK